MVNFSDDDLHFSKLGRSASFPLLWSFTFVRHHDIFAPFKPANLPPRIRWRDLHVAAPESLAAHSAPAARLWEITLPLPSLCRLSARRTGCAQSATQHPSPRQHDVPACCLYSVLMCRPSLPSLTPSCSRCYRRFSFLFPLTRIG